MTFRHIKTTVQAGRTGDEPALIGAVVNTIAGVGGQLRNRCNRPGLTVRFALGTESRNSTPGLKKKQAWAFPQLSNAMFELASSGMPRLMFLKEVLRLVIEYAGCDQVKLVFLDQGNRYRCRVAAADAEPFRFDKTPVSRCQEGGYLWSSEENDKVEQLCREVVAGRISSAPELGTPRGSLVANSVSRSILSDIGDSRSSSELGINLEKGSRSIMIIPILSGKERIGLLELESAKESYFAERELNYLEGAAHSLSTAMIHRSLQVSLRERSKELTCLYGIAKLAAHPDSSLDNVMKQAVELLPPGWLHPDCAVAKIMLDGKTFCSPGYQRTVQTIRSPVTVDSQDRGFVEVGYIWDQLQLDEGPFLKEERHLIDAVAREIGQIVEQMEGEVEKHGLEEQLRHADRLATIGQLAAGAAHELNEPLANILGFAQLALKAGNLKDQAKTDIEKIVAAVLHAREVVRKLLLFARQTIPQTSRCSLSNLVEEGLYFLESRCTRAGIEVVQNLATKLPDITADKSQLQQVLTNLVVNAIQAMPAGGKLSISTLVEGDHVLLVVEDTGVGMTDETLKRIFDPFFTTKDVSEGTGLGLSVVHGIVSSHKGSIEVHSVYGKGSTFTIRLPFETPQQGDRDGE